ncbi:MAG: tRNA (adenosine(37)-N6)-dimethylallyltransferase MiaA [Bacteroidales bacterium]|nr:tRNA (adenosine(37)-N6)-dimethylallyltransferase MiaA [Bacteroidales bacterium]
MTSAISRLILILGPTASGKTAHAIRLAQELKTEIVSCDSRQFYSELDIGVARPSPEELAAAPHHFIACRSVEEPFNVFSYEQEALRKLDTLFQRHDTVIAVGGSGLYIEALCRGISVLPDPAPQLRAELQQKLRTEGVESLRLMLKQLDPDYYAQVDLANGVRIQRALEVCLTAGKPYSQLIRQPHKPRPFTIETTIIERSRDELRQRINRRVDMMMDSGLEEEAQKLYPLRRLTPLNTVGYKEFFTLWEKGQSPRPLSREQRQQVTDAIRLNTWHYAKKQLTWLKKYPSRTL